MKSFVYSEQFGQIGFYENVGVFGSYVVLIVYYLYVIFRIVDLLHVLQIQYIYIFMKYAINNYVAILLVTIFKKIL